MNVDSILTVLLLLHREHVKIQALSQCPDLHSLNLIIDTYKITARVKVTEVMRNIPSTRLIQYAL